MCLKLASTARCNRSRNGPGGEATYPTILFHADEHFPIDSKPWDIFFCIRPILEPGTIKRQEPVRAQAAGVARDGTGKTAPKEAIGSIMAVGWEAKMGILVYIDAILIGSYPP